MRVMKYEPGKPGKIVEIPNELAPLQEAVGGYIEAVHFKDEMLIICNEEGRIHGLPENRWGICGTFIVCGDFGEEFRGLTDEEVDYLRRRVL